LKSAMESGMWKGRTGGPADRRTVIV